MKIRVSFSTAALFPMDTVEALKTLEKAGFRYAELMPQCMEETKPEFAKRVLGSTRIAIGSIHFPLVFFPVFYNPYPGMQKDAKAMVEDLVSLAESLGSEVVVIHPPYSDEETKKIFYDRVVENIRYLCERASRRGIKVALENSPKGGRTPEEILRTIREVAHRNLFPMVDTTEAVESGQDPVRMIEALKPIHVHASDHRGEEKHLPPGEGCIDWGAIVDTLRRQGFSGLFTVEPSYRYFLKSPLEALRRTLGFVEKLVE